MLSTISEQLKPECHCKYDGETSLKHECDCNHEEAQAFKKPEETPTEDTKNIIEDVLK